MLQYLQLVLLSVWEDSYYYMLAFWPTTLYTAVWMVLRLSADELEGHRIGNILLEASKLVRQLRWLMEIPTMMMLYYEICDTRRNPVLWIAVFLIFYVLVAFTYCLYEGMQEACENI